MCDCVCACVCVCVCVCEIGSFLCFCIWNYITAAQFNSTSLLLLMTERMSLDINELHFINLYIFGLSDVRQLCCDWLCFIMVLALFYHGITNSCIHFWRHQYLLVAATNMNEHDIDV